MGKNQKASRQSTTRLLGAQPSILHDEFEVGRRKPSQTHLKFSVLPDESKVKGRKSKANQLENVCDELHRLWQ
jgi:hypothetical protein